MTTAQDRKAEERKAAADKAHAELVGAIDALMTSEAWERMITSRKDLRKYSLNNLLMILLQCPHASDVRPYGARVNPAPGSWKAVGRYARPGEKALRIYAPSFRKDDNGDDKLIYFRLVPVFDVSQTDGDPLPYVAETRPELLTGDAPAKLWDAVAKMIADAGYSLSRAADPVLPDANGVTTWSARTVTVREDLDPAQAVKTLIHELAHILLGHGNDRKDTSRGRGEVEAESVACVVAAVAGLDSHAYSVPYVAGWAADRTEVEASAKIVLKVADQILERLGL